MVVASTLLVNTPTSPIFQSLLPTFFPKYIRKLTEAKNTQFFYIDVS